MRKKVICLICALALCMVQVMPVFADNNEEENYKSLEYCLEHATKITLGEKVEGKFKSELYQWDYYEIHIPKEQFLSIRAATSVKEFLLTIYDEEGQAVKNFGAYKFGGEKQTKIDLVYKLPAGTYYIEAHSRKDIAPGQYSFTIAKAKPLAAVKKLELKKKQKTTKNGKKQVGITINLNKLSDVQIYRCEIYYNLYIADNPNFKNKLDVITTGSYTEWLKPGKTYYVKARLMQRTWDDEDYYGKFTKTKKIKL